MRGKVWLVGENNPYGSASEFALYPSPRGCAGQRLCKALGLDEDAYLETFERRNLLSVMKWSVKEARRAAGLLLVEAGPGDALVLCGAKVSEAFGLPFSPLMAVKNHKGQTLLVIPHPSGLSRLFNQKGMSERVRDAVMALVKLREVEHA